ncbi:MAG TPA: hypothetical protein VHG52_14955, partial [Thermomicrobiales bacterium]|nr:hypothetical protein [Thermomicrobiales bacterium]
MLATASAHAAPESLVWNPGPQYKASITYTKTFSPANDWGCVASGTTLEEAHLVGNPGGSFTDPNLLQCEGNTFVPLASNGAAPSYSPGAAIGWTSADEDEVPGWSIQRLSGGGGTPMVMRYVNRGEGTGDDCELREVGMGYQHWPNLAVSAFKPNPGGGGLRVGEFEEILGKVSMRETYAGGQSQCEELPTGALNIGFRVDYVKPDGSSERSDAVATIVRGLPGNIDFNGIEDDIYYRNHDGSAVVVYGESVGLPTVSSSWQDYTIDFKALLEEYVPPPAGYSVHDAVIVGFDIFSSLRGADMDFEAKDLDLVGVRRAV